MHPGELVNRDSGNKVSLKGCNAKFQNLPQGQRVRSGAAALVIVASVLDDQPNVVLAGEGQAMLNVLDIAHINIPRRNTTLLAVANGRGDCIRIK